MANTAHVPFGLGAVMPSVALVGGPRTVPGALFARSRAPWAAGATWQRRIDAQPQAANPCGLPAQPKPSNQSSKHYPHTTRIAAGDGGAKGPHPARDPV